MTQEDDASRDENLANGNDDEEEGMKEDPFLKDDMGFGSGRGPGKIGSFVSKMGPILENKDMFFTIVDNAVLPQLNEVLDKYLYGEYMNHKAKFLFSYHQSLKEAGFSDERAGRLVEIQAEKDSFFKLLLEVMPDVIHIISKFTPKRGMDAREEIL